MITGYTFGRVQGDWGNNHMNIIKLVKVGPNNNQNLVFMLQLEASIPRFDILPDLTYSPSFLKKFRKILEMFANPRRLYGRAPKNFIDT